MHVLMHVTLRWFCGGGPRGVIAVWIDLGTTVRILAMPPDEAPASGKVGKEPNKGKKPKKFHAIPQPATLDTTQSADCRTCNNRLTRREIERVESSPGAIPMPAPLVTDAPSGGSGAAVLFRTRQPTAC